MGGKLTAAFVTRTAAPGVYSDGPGAFGLSLRVRNGARGVSKTWVQRIRIDGRPTYLGLGRFPVVTLREARLAALENYRTVYRGGDPRRKRETDGLTFGEAAARVIALRAKTWKTDTLRQHWEHSLAHYAASLAGKPVREITRGDVLRCIQPEWSSKPSATRRALQRIRTVLAWCAGAGHAERNVADDSIEAALPRQNGRTKHHKSIPYADLPAALAKIRGGKGREAARLAFEYCALTGVRSAEARGATWSEIDWETGVWTIPAGRIKTGRDHAVPLSREALAVLENARALGSGTLCFPAPKSGRMLASTELRIIAREASAGTTVHGLRSSLRDWLAARGTPRDIAESVLAHIPRGTRGAYLRDDLLEARVPIMERWGRYVAGGDGTLMERD